MSNYVLDTSAVLAYIFQETGFEQVEKIIDDSIINTVNYAELITKLTLIVKDMDDITAILQKNDLDITPFDVAEAEIAGDLVSLTKPLGLSLGDRACIATGLNQKLTVVTADKIWAKLKCGVKIIVIR